MTIRQIIGENIRGFRNILKLSQTEFAKRAHLNRSHLSSIEQGEENLTIDSLERIATILGVPIHVLLIEQSHTWARPKTDT